MKLWYRTCGDYGLSSKTGGKMTTALTEPKRPPVYGSVHQNVRVVLNPYYVRPTQQ